MSNSLDTLWYTRCPVPTGLGIALQKGWLEESFRAQCTNVQSLRESNDKAVRESNQLITAMTQQLAALSNTSGSFSRSMHQVAVSDEEQSKAMSELAATAHALTDVAERLSELVGIFKLGDS